MCTVAVVMLHYHLLGTVSRGHLIAVFTLLCAQCSFSLYQRYLNFIWCKKNKHQTMAAYFSFHLFWFCDFFFSEIEKFQGSDGKKEDEEKKYLDVISNKNIKLSERVLIPVKQYPKVLHAACTLFSLCLGKNSKCLGFH